MPTILRIKGYKFYFYMADLEEPPHIHVYKDGCEAKFWANPISLARSGGFPNHDLNMIERIIQNNKSIILKAWYQEKAKYDDR